MNASELRIRAGITALGICGVLLLCVIAMQAGYFDAGYSAAGLLAIQNLAVGFNRRNAPDQPPTNP